MSGARQVHELVHPRLRTVDPAHSPAGRAAAHRTRRPRGRHPATETITNQDDITALLCVYRGGAFRALGHHTAAREVLKEALRIRKCLAAVRHAAFCERAATNLADGKRAQARKDAERVLAEDSTHQRARALLEQASVKR